MTTPLDLYRIEAPHFVVGIVVRRGGACTQSAPIVHYMKGWPLSKIEAYAQKRGWKIDPIEIPGSF